MNYRSSSWTGRAPNSMQAAFGPYTSNHIEEPAERHWQDWVVYAVCLFAFLLVLAGVIR